MAKKAPETVVMTVNEKKFINMDFSADIDGSDSIATIDQVSFVPGGPTFSQSSSGKILQIKVTGSIAASTTYKVNARVTTNTAAETFEGQGILITQVLG